MGEALVFCRIMKLMECGHINRWKKQHWPRAQCRTTDTRLVTRKVTLGDMWGNFYVIFIGALVAFGVLLLECICRPSAKSNVPRAGCHDSGDVELFRITK